MVEYNISAPKKNGQMSPGNKNNVINMRQRLANDIEPIMNVSDDLNLKAKTIGKQICGEQTRRLKEANSARLE